jgi:RNA polymerase sigma-70 factor (sigma-E family)
VEGGDSRVATGGDRESFDDFVRARSAVLLRAAYLLAGDRHLAEDLVQETLVRVAQHWSRVHHEGNPEAYARQVLYTRAVDSWRWRRRRPPEVGGMPMETVDAVGIGAAVDAVEAIERQLVVRAALARLTPKQRAVLVLRFFEDRTESDTAAVLNCSVGTVKSQTRHALDRLRVLAPELAEAFGQKVVAP